MIFRIVLLENAFDSYAIIIALKLLPQKCMVQSRLVNLTSFITHTQVFYMTSHQLTYIHVLDEINVFRQLYILCFISQEKLISLFSITDICEAKNSYKSLFYKENTDFLFYDDLFLYFFDAIFQFSFVTMILQSSQYSRLFPVFSIIPPHRLQREYFLCCLTP